MLFALFYLFLFFFNQTKTVSFILCAQVDRECAEEKRGEWRQQLLETTKLIGNEHFVQHHLERWFLTLCWTSSLTFRHYVVSFPTRWSFSFILGPLHWSFLTSREQRNIVQLCTRHHIMSHFNFRGGFKTVKVLSVKHFNQHHLERWGLNILEHHCEPWIWNL